jgi:NADH-quinone oxidoreductase subunit G/NADP-reducing hydrogenase subunit HndD
MQVKIDGNNIEVNGNETILEAAQKTGIKIPTLCYHADLHPKGVCRVCIVEANGKIVSSCNTHVKEGMEIRTDSEKVMKYRKLNTELLSVMHSIDHLEQVEEMHELHGIVKDLGLTETRFKKIAKEITDKSSSFLELDNNKCVLCGRCISACQEVQNVNAIELMGRGFYTKVSTALGQFKTDAACTSCGLCSLFCPSDAIKEKDDTENVLKAIDDPKKHVIAQTAPSVRASLGEPFNMPPGSLVTGKMVSSLKSLGFDKVFDTAFGADMTSVEEAYELLERLEKREDLPLFTSCCPGWIRFVENFYPEIFPNISTCKSPQHMFGAIAKTYYAEKFNIKPKDIVVVSIMPCIAKKFEIARDNLKTNKYKDVDFVLTTRELARLIKKKNIDFSAIEESSFDDPLGVSTGGGVIFGATGGVAESVLRIAYEIITKKELKEIDFYQVRGLEGIKEAEINLGDKKLKVAIAHGLGNARKIVEKVKTGNSSYDVIEVMACPGGCIGGGGQPKPTTKEIVKKRSEALYNQDKNMQIRSSHKNPVVKKIYEEFLGEPLSKKSEKLLHTKSNQK